MRKKYYNKKSINHFLKKVYAVAMQKVSHHENLNEKTKTIKEDFSFKRQKYCNASILLYFLKFSFFLVRLNT